MRRLRWFLPLVIGAAALVPIAPSLAAEDPIRLHAAAPRYICAGAPMRFGVATYRPVPYTITGLYYKIIPNINKPLGYASKRTTSMATSIPWVYLRSGSFVWDAMVRLDGVGEAHASGVIDVVDCDPAIYKQMARDKARFDLGIPARKQQIILNKLADSAHRGEPARVEVVVPRHDTREIFVKFNWVTWRESAWEGHDGFWSPSASDYFRPMKSVLLGPIPPNPNPTSWPLLWRTVVEVEIPWMLGYHSSSTNNFVREWQPIAFATDARDLLQLGTTTVLSDCP